METKRKARKDYICNYCGNVIKAGEYYVKFKIKLPKFDIDDNQIGIEYSESNLCLDCSEVTE